MNNKRFWLLVGGIILLIAAFLFLDFRLSASRTRADTFTVTMKLPVPQQRSEKISMLVAGEGPLVRALREALLKKLGEAGMSRIELVKELEPGNRSPVLVVNVGRPSPIWTPLFSMSQLPVQVGYASDGDTDFMESIAKTRTSVGKKDASNLYAEFTVNDRSLGLISRPGYHRFLAEYLAQMIVAALQELYNG